jgi:ATP-dependent Lhr-like helicase
VCVISWTKTLRTSRSSFGSSRWRASHTLIAAPTGSGKTLAAFLTAIDELVREGLAQGAAAGRGPRRLRLAAEGAERRHPQEPRRAARGIARSRGDGARGAAITAAVRTGDTPQSERAAMLRTPPHILVTTPESLYLLLTAERSREMLRTCAR